MINLKCHYYPELNFNYNYVGDHDADTLSAAIISSTIPEIGGGSPSNWAEIDYDEVYERAEEFLMEQLGDQSSDCYELFIDRLRKIYEEDGWEEEFCKSFDELNPNELEGIGINYLDNCQDIQELIDSTVFKEINGDLETYCTEISNDLLESGEFKQNEHNLYESIFYKVQDVLEDFHSADYEMNEEGYVEATFRESDVDVDDDSANELISRLKAIIPYVKEQVISYVKPIEAKLSNGFVVFRRIPGDFEVKFYHDLYDLGY